MLKVRLNVFNDTELLGTIKTYIPEELIPENDLESYINFDIVRKDMFGLHFSCERILDPQDCDECFSNTGCWNSIHGHKCGNTYCMWEDNSEEEE